MVATTSRDVWQAPARPTPAMIPGALGASQDAVLRRYLPMARTLAPTTGSGGQPVDPVHAEQAVEIGLVQAVVGVATPGP